MDILGGGHHSVPHRSFTGTRGKREREINGGAFTQQFLLIPSSRTDLGAKNILLKNQGKRAHGLRARLEQKWNRAWVVGGAAAHSVPRWDSRAPPTQAALPTHRRDPGEKADEHSAATEAHDGKQQGGKNAQLIQVTSVSCRPESGTGAHRCSPRRENPHGRWCGLRACARSSCTSAL